MKYKIEHIKLLLDGKYELLPKCLGVELVELGFLKYIKLTPENYNYWWYEVADLSKIDKKAFTYDWKNLEMTKKCDWFKELIGHHEDCESMYNIITPILNLESAKNIIDIATGKLDTELLKEIYYGNRYKPKQMELQLA
jgi:hypothetical protein